MTFYTQDKMAQARAKQARTYSTNGYRSKPECVKGALDPNDFGKLTGTVAVQLTKDTNENSKRVAKGSLTIAGCFVIYISVYKGRNGYFISYPNYKDNEGEYHDLAYCFDRNVIDGLTALITEMIDGK